MGTHFSFLFSIYSENHGVQAEPLNFTRSSDITYVRRFLQLTVDNGLKVLLQNCSFKAVYALNKFGTEQVKGEKVEDIYSR